MTNFELPTAAEALAMAYAIVKSPCSAAETQRAELLFEIGRELRIAADMRAINARRAMLDRARDQSKLDAVGIPRPSAYEPQVVPAFATEASQAADRYAAMMRDAGYAGEPAAERVERLAAARLPDFAATQVFPKAVVDEPTQLTPTIDEPTTQFAIVWQAGDKADCRHCHTPIVFEARRMKDPLREGEDDGATQYVWVHKYSDDRTCEGAAIGDTCTLAGVGDHDCAIGPCRFEYPFAEPSR